MHKAAHEWVTIDPRLHLSRRVIGFEQLDDARIGLNGREDVVELQLFGLRLFVDGRLPELIDDGGDIGLLEQFAHRGALILHLRLLERGEGGSADLIAERKVTAGAPLAVLSIAHEGPDRRAGDADHDRGG